jgi:hypothetical protein
MTGHQCQSFYIINVSRSNLSGLGINVSGVSLPIIALRIALPSEEVETGGCQCAASDEAANGLHRCCTASANAQHLPYCVAIVLFMCCSCVAASDEGANALHLPRFASSSSHDDEGANVLHLPRHSPVWCMMQDSIPHGLGSMRHRTYSAWPRQHATQDSVYDALVEDRRAEAQVEDRQADAQVEDSRCTRGGQPSRNPSRGEAK